MTRPEIHEDLCKELHNLYVKKNSDYGDSYSKLRNKYPQSIIIRLSDKLNRLESLVQNGYEARVEDESLVDTLMDIANYALMEVVEMIREDLEDLEYGDCDGEYLNGKKEFTYKLIRTFGPNSEVKLLYDTDEEVYVLDVDDLVEHTSDKCVDLIPIIEDEFRCYVEKNEPRVIPLMVRPSDIFDPDHPITGECMRDVFEMFQFICNGYLKYYKDFLPSGD